MNLAARRLLRSRTRDLAAASAFASVALSGALPPPVLAAFALGFGASFAGFRPLARRRAWSAVVMLALAAALFGSVALGQLNLLLAAVAFASLVAVHRMVSEPGPGTDQQVLLASLLLIAGGAALSGEIWYAACLLGFGVFACLSMGLAVIEGPVERDDPLPLQPVLRQVSVGVAFALLGGLAFFVLFPRLSWNIAARRTPPGLLGGTTGMTDRVRLGGTGDIKTSARVVLRAQLNPDPGVEQLERYWVGRYFDGFDGREWRGSGTARPPRVTVNVGESGVETIHQRIELLPSWGARTVVALDTPVMFGNAMMQSTSGSAPVLFVEVEDEEVRLATDANGYTYHAYSRWPADHTAPTASVPERYLALPSLDARVQALAVRAGGEGTPAQIARRLEAHLKSSYAYTLELPGEVADPLADFLFERRAGHCEHFATALAVLLRVRGIPSRVVGGFYGGERVGERYVVRAGDAHAWTQAFVPGDGWLALDATPDDGLRGQPTAWLATLTGLYERLEDLWRSRVVDYSFADQLRFARDLVRPPQTALDAGSAFSAPGRAWLGALLAAALTWAVYRLLSRPRPPPPHPAASFRDQLELRLARAHIARQAGEGLEELTARLVEARHPLAGPVAAAVRRYVEARFGGRPLPREERARLLSALSPPAP